MWRYFLLGKMNNDYYFIPLFLMGRKAPHASPIGIGPGSHLPRPTAICLRPGAICLLIGAAYGRMRLADRPYVICELFCNLFACKASNFVFCLFYKDNWKRKKTMVMFYTFFVFLYYLRRSVFLRSDSQSKIVIVLFSRFADSSFVSIN